MSAPVVELESLSVPGRVANVTFTVPLATTFALVGPNGSGKSTVLDAVLGLVPHHGRCVVRAASMAVVPQRLTVPSVLPLRVLDFLALQRTRWPVVLGLGARLRDRLHALLEAARLGHLATRQLSLLSGGELRRLLLADALERAPALLLLDEPEAGLDAASRDWLDEVLASLPGRGLTTLLVTHDLGRVARHATGSLTLGASDV